MDITPALDDLRARALLGEDAPWPAEWNVPKALEAAERRLLCQDIARLLHARRDRLSDRPQALLDTLRQEALAQAMWELRHRLLVGLIESLSQADTAAPVMKNGTGLRPLIRRDAPSETHGGRAMSLREPPAPAAPLRDRIDWIVRTLASRGSC